MKKFLSVLLAVMMVLSTVSFAAPSLAGVADTAVEAPAFEAPAADLAAEYPILHSLEFTDGKDGISYGRGWTNEHDAVNGYLKVYPGASYTQLNDVHWSNSLSGLNLVASNIYDIQLRVRFTNYTANSYAGYVYTACSGGSWSGTNMTWKKADGTTLAVDGNWMDVSLKATMGANWDKFVTGTLNALRFDLSIKHPEDVIVEFDYIRFVGYPVQKIMVDMGENTAVADQEIVISENTTAADLLGLIDLGSTVSSLGPKALAAGGVELAADAKVAEYDEVTVIWGYYDTFGFNFDEALAEGQIFGNDNKFVLDTTTEGIARLTTNANPTYTKDGVVVETNAIRADRARFVIKGLNIPANNVEKIYMKLRYTAKPENGMLVVCDENGKSSTYDANYTGWDFWWYDAAVSTASPYDGAGMSTPYTMPALNEWVYVTIDAKAILGDKRDGTVATDANGNFLVTKFLDSALTTLRFDFWSGSSFSIPSGITVEIDDVIILGSLVYDSTADLSGAGMENQAVTFSKSTKVKDYLAKIDLSSYSGILVPAGITANGVALDNDAFVADYFEEGDTVAVTWKPNNSIIKSYEFNTDGNLEGVDFRKNEYGIVNTVENGAFKIDFTNATDKFNDTHSGSSVVVNAKAGELSDIVMRFRVTGSPNAEQIGVNFYADFGAGISSSSNMGQNWVPYVEGEWVEISVKELRATHWALITGSDLKALRFGFSNPSGEPAANNNTVIEIDYIRYICDPVEIKVDMGTNTVDADCECIVTAATTAAQLLEKIAQNCHDVYTPVELSVGETVLAADAKVVEALAGGDTVTVSAWENAYETQNILWGYEATAQNSNLFQMSNMTSVTFKDGVAKGVANGPTQSYCVAGTANAPINVKYADIEDVVVRVRFTGGVEGNHSCSFFYCPVDGAYSEANKTGVTVPLKNDVWYELSYKAMGIDFTKLNGDTLTSFRTPHILVGALPVGASMEVDYVRVIGHPKPVATAPANEGKQLRNFADEYDNAIRFKASVDAATNEASETIGWLVSTEAYLDGAELNYAAYEAAASNKVKVAYQRKNGEAVVKNFFDDRDDDKKIFAAFIYNIPAKNALDNVVVRPFVVAEGEYFYGEAVTTNLYEMAVAPYVTLEDITVEELVDAYESLEEALADGFLTVDTSALGAEQAEYVESVLDTIIAAL